MNSRRIARSLALLAALILGWPLHAQRGGRGGQPPATVIDDVTLIDGTGGVSRPHVSLVLRGGKVAAIVPAGQEPPDVTNRIDGHGAFAIPGLIDAHVHITSSTHDRAVGLLGRALAGGVTSVFDLAGDTRLAGELSREVIAGEVVGPTVVYVALMGGPPFFTDPRVIGASRGYTPGTAPWMQAITPDTDVVRAVAMARGTGAAALKLYAALDAATVKRIVPEAHRQGFRVVAHATVFPAKPGDLVDAGVDMLAHAAYLVWEGSPATGDYTKRASGDFAGVPAGSPAIDGLLRSMHDHHVALNPTLWIFAVGQASDPVSASRTPWMYAVTRRAAELGVSIVAGTDDLADEQRDPLPLIHRELEQLVTGAGMSPQDALLAATRNAARIMGIDAERGTLEVGKAADLLLLDANPLDDIRNTRRIRTVIKEGRIIE